MVGKACQGEMMFVLALVLGFVSGVAASYLASVIRDRQLASKLALDTQADMYANDPGYRRIAHIRLWNAGGQTAHCQATATFINSAGDTVASVPVRFTRNPTPTVSSFLAPETVVLEQGWSTLIPLAVKVEGRADAHVFMPASHAFPDWCVPASIAPPLPPGQYRVVLSVDYGGKKPCEREFLLHNDGTSAKGLTVSA